MNNQTTRQIIARVENASKLYKTGDTTITALQPTSIGFNKGELTLIIGPSGSGKTTLLSLLGCVVYPTEGNVFIDEKLTSGLNAKQLSALRLHKIGFVFQGFNLIAPLNSLENVMLPLQLLDIPQNEARDRAIEALEVVGMKDRMKNLPKMLSGGQQQRVAIARALVTNPPLILCDEPTAALDSKSVGTVMEELHELSEKGKSVIVVTHDMRLAKFADRIITVENGIATEQINFQNILEH